MPTVFILYPNTLYDYQGKNLSEIGVSGALHLLRPDSQGNVQICHYHPDDWTGRHLLIHVMLHAKMWIEALEEHQRTGTPLDYYLMHPQN